jgi:GAF domain-containing protein
MTDGVVSVEKLSLLFELSRAFTAQIELQELLPLIMAQTQAALGAENCSLLLLDEAKQELFFPVTSDVRPEVGAQLQEIRFPANRGIAGWVLQHSEAALVPDVTQDPRFYPDVDKQSGAHTRDLLYAPLRTRSGSIGVIGLRNKREGSFTQDDLAFLNALTGTVAIAIENARLYQRVKQSESQLKE